MGNGVSSLLKYGYIFMYNLALLSLQKGNNAEKLFSHLGIPLKSSLLLFLQFLFLQKTITSSDHQQGFLYFEEVLNPPDASLVAKRHFSFLFFRFLQKKANEMVGDRFTRLI